METNFNLGSLKIVQAPLMEYFKKALANVEANLILVRDEKKVPTSHESIEILVKTQKTLEMIGLKGLSKVLSITEEGLLAVKEMRFDSKKNIEILEISTQILKNSSSYIQRLVSTGLDQPKQFYGDYQKISKLLGKQAQIKDLFFPKLDLNSNVNEQIQSDLRTGIFINDNSKKNLILHLEKVHNIIQSKLTTIFGVLEVYGEFNSNDEKNAYQNICKQIYEGFDYAQKLKVNKNFFILFGIYKLYICTLSPIFNENFVKYVAERQSLIKSNLAKMERVLARLIQNIKEMEIGEKTGSLRVDDESVKEIILELVYSIRNNEKLKEMPVYKDLEEYFDLDYFDEQLTDNDVSSVSVILSDEQVQEIEKNFLDMKEEFTILNTKKAGSDEFGFHLSRIIGNNKKIVELAPKELTAVSSLVGGAFDMVKSQSLSFDDVFQREISLAFVLIEYGINSFIKNSVEDRLKKDYQVQVKLQMDRIQAVCNKDLNKLSKLELPKIDKVSQKSDEKKIFAKIFTKLEDDLTKIEDVLDYFLKNDGENVSELESIYKPLIGMKGMFSAIGKQDLGKVVTKIAEPWKKIIDNGAESVDREELNESISLVGGLSLLVKAFVGENETTADEIYGNLMKKFYQNNSSEIDNDTHIPEFLTETSKPAVVVEQAKPVEDDGFEFVFEIEDQNGVQPQSFSHEEKATPAIEEQVAEEKFEFGFEETPAKQENVNVSENTNNADAAEQAVGGPVVYKEGTDDPELSEVFLMEAEEVLANMASSLDALNKNLDNAEEIKNIRRYFHTLKGSGRMVGLNFTGEAAWMVEQTLNKCLSNELPFNSELLQSIQDMRVRFENWVAELKDVNEVNVDLVSIKQIFIVINPQLTNSIEVTLPTAGDEVSMNVPEETFSFETPAQPVVEAAKEEEEFNFNIAEESTEELSVEIPKESFSFEVPAEPVAEAPKEEEFNFNIAEESKEELSVEIPQESFSFEIPAEPVAEAPKEEEFNFNIVEESKEELSLEIPQESFSFEAPAEPVAEAPKEELSLEIPQEEFNFEISTQPVAEAPKEEFNFDIPAEPVAEIPSEEFNFDIPAEPVAEAPKEELSLEIPQEEFSFEIPAEPVAEAPKEEFNFDIPAEPVAEVPKEEFNFDIPAEPVAEAPSEEFNFDIPTEPVAEAPKEEFNFDIPAEPVAEAPKEEFNFDIPTEPVAEAPKEEFSFEIDLQSEAEAPKEDIAVVESVANQEDNDTMYVDGKPVSRELFELYTLESSSQIAGLKQVAHSQYTEPMLLNEEFMRYAHTLCSISRSVCLDKLGTLAKKLEEVADECMARNTYLSQQQMDIIRETIDSFELFQNIDSSEHPSGFENLVEQLDNIYSQVNNVGQPEEIKEVQNVVVDTEKLKNELLGEVDSLISEHNKKLLQDVIERENVSKEFVKDLILKIDNLEEQLGGIKEAQGEKERLFEEQLEKIQEAQKERDHLYNKALEVTKNDIRTLAHIIKKKYEVANQAILHESLQEEVNETGLDSQESKPTPDITEIMAEYAEEAKNLISVIEEVEVKVAINEEDIAEVNAVLESVGDIATSQSSQALSEEDLKIQKLLEQHNFILKVFEDKVASVSDELDMDLYDISREEAQEMFDSINPLVEQINEGGLANEDSKALKRYLHTLKGSLRMAGANKVGMLAHRLESLLDYTESRNMNLFAFKPLLEKEMNKIYFLMKDPSQELDAKKIAWLDEIVDASVQQNSIQNIAEVNSVNLSEEDTKIKALLEQHGFINKVFEDKVASVQDELDVDLYDISREEAQEMFDNINPLVEQINESGLAEEDSKALKRYLHTLKGSLRMAGANKVGMLSHRLESILDYTESRKINLFAFKPLLEKEMNKISFLMKDPNQVLDAKKIAWLDEIIDESIEANASNVVNNTTASDFSEKETTQNVRNDAKKEAKQYIRIASDVVDSAINDAGEIRLARSSLEDTTTNTKKSITELKTSSNKLLKMVKEIEVQAESQIQANKAHIDENDSSFDPLEFDRFTRLQELTRLMSEAVSDIDETITFLAGTAKVQDNAINTQSIITNNLLSQLLKVRLVPVETISERFYKIARNTAKELGKRVSLEIIGEKTEVDKLILDKVISPIEHLLRNSIAHGIEMPEKRLEMNKQPIGKIILDVALDGNFTTIKIKDDGAGINVEKIREIAIKKGMIKENLEYSQDEIINLIFQSGFSTADSVSQVAGRGVGMDVVKNDILAVGGTIKIETEKNRGSVFTLTLPMEVATTQAMLCNVRDKLIAIPAILIEEIDSVKESEIKDAYSTSKFTINGVAYPFYYIGSLLGLVDSKTIPDPKLYNSIIRVNYMGESIVIHVDKLLTTTEILVKNLGTVYSKITGLLGVTVLGDGSQGIVINPVQLLEHFNKNLKKVSMSINVDSEREKNVSKITVLVVDDSITVRRASSKMLERNNFTVVLAKDGEDALEQLQLHSPNIILSDIEMPRMDGFEFVKNVRSVEKYSHIPIIMITSRTAEKHQKHAFELGANDFLGKPYKEEELIEKIQSLLEYNKEFI